MKTPVIPPKLGLVIAVAAFSFPAIFIRFAQADALSIAFLRLFFAALILLPVSYKRVFPALRALSPVERWKVFSAGLFLGLHMFLWVTAVTKTTVASASFLIITQPILVAILGHFLLREKLNRFVSIAIVLTIIGSLMINWGDVNLGPEFLRGDFLAICGAIMAAFYLLAGRSVRQRIDLLPYITLVYSIASIVLLPIWLLYGASLSSLSGNSWFWIIMLTLIPTLIGHSLYNWALRYLKAFTVNASIIVEPIGATLMAWFFFQEQPNLWLYPGGVLLTMSIFLAFRGEEV